MSWTFPASLKIWIDPLEVDGIQQNKQQQQQQKKTIKSRPGSFNSGKKMNAVTTMILTVL